MSTPSVTSDTSDIDDEQYELRHIGIFSENGEVSMKLSAYTDVYGKKRIMLNDLDISLDDFNNCLSCVCKRETSNDIYVGMKSGFLNGIIALFLLGVILAKIDCWV